MKIIWSWRQLRIEPNSLDLLIIIKMILKNLPIAILWINNDRILIWKLCWHEFLYELWSFNLWNNHLRTNDPTVMKPALRFWGYVTNSDCSFSCKSVHVTNWVHTGETSFLMVEIVSHLQVTSIDDVIKVARLMLRRK